MGLDAPYPVLFDHGKTIQLNDNHGGQYMLADTGSVTALNDAGDAVGVIDGGDVPFIVPHGGKLQSLRPLFPNVAALPIAINNRGEILLSAGLGTGSELYLLSKR